MIKASLLLYAEVMDIMETHYGYDSEHVIGVHSTLSNSADVVLLSDSKESMVVFKWMYDGVFHIHHASKRGGKDHADLLRDAVGYMFGKRKADTLIGIVPVSDRKTRLLIGMNSRIKPVATVGDNWFYILTKEDVEKVRL